jgi:beta-glucanase (GH16 family)
MKKLIIFILGFLSIVLVGCSLDNTTTVTNSETTTEITTNQETTTLQTTTEEATTEETTTESTYDDRSLVPEDCYDLENIGDWQPVWCDEFNYTGLPDSTKWSYDVGGGGWGNGEEQYYTNADPDNVDVSDGTLKINLLKEGSTYTSARMITKYKGDWLYGKIQVKAKLPEGSGTWPAIWMLPTDWRYGGWPDSGEIDIMEHVGNEPTKVHGTIHTAAYNHSLNTQIGYTKTVNDAETAFHVYELEWEPGRMQVFVDGVSYGVFGFNPLYNINTDNEDAWPFDQRFHLILNIAFGGSWGSAGGIDWNLEKATMEIDYVRVYQKDYAGLDQAAPSEVEDFSVMKSSITSIKVYWDKAFDDIMVEKYEIYVDGVLDGSTTLNSYEVKDLDPGTMYLIDVVAVDFAGNRSQPVSLNLSTENARSLLGKIEAEDYDYQSGMVREASTDIGGGENLSWIDTNDYAEYILNVEEAGIYQVTYRVASLSVGGEIKIYGKSSLPLATTSLPVTGGWQVWTDVTSTTFTLSEGLYTFKIRASEGGFNLNYFEFEKVG